MTITEIITIAVSAAMSLIVGGFLRHVSKAFKHIRGDFQTLKDAQRDSLRYQIVQAHDYFVSQGRIGKYSLDCIEDMYASYHKLGGNGFITGIMAEVRALPKK